VSHSSNGVKGSPASTKGSVGHTPEKARPGKSTNGSGNKLQIADDELVRFMGLRAMLTFRESFVLVCWANCGHLWD
jgi:hypothetical protein